MKSRAQLLAEEASYKKTKSPIEYYAWINSLTQDERCIIYCGCTLVELIDRAIQNDLHSQYGVVINEEDIPF